MIRQFVRSLLILSLGAAVGCGNGGPAGPAAETSPLAVRFRAVQDPSAKPGVNALRKPVVVDGINGRLTLNRVTLVVDEFELEGSDECEDDDDVEAAEDEFEAIQECGEFESDPHILLLDLASTTSEDVLIREPAPVGTYTSLKFEVDDLDDDDGRLLLSELRQTVPDWPENAGMLVEGTFTAAGTPTATPFRTFFDGEIEIEMEFSPPLVLTAEDDAGVEIVIDPGRWFEGVNNRVRDLTQLDFDATGQIHELEVELKDGFTKIEIETEED